MSAVSKILVLAGGQSPEHEVSISSARFLSKSLGNYGTNLKIIVITREGLWLNKVESESALETGHADSGGQSPLHCLELQEKDTVVFPVVHGATGEDGTLPGFLESLSIPYIGCGVTSSAACLDKSIFKHIAAGNNFPQTKFQIFDRYDWQSKLGSLPRHCFANLSIPVFVKPCSLGSSLGVSKVSKESELLPAIEKAFSLDPKIVIEEAVENLWELEVGIIGSNKNPRASPVAKITHSSQSKFLDYDTKYGEGTSIIFECPALLPSGLREECHAMAFKIWRVFGCEGLARVDFLYDWKKEALVINEVNTLPGFGPSSHFVKLWEAGGMSLGQVTDVLVELALSGWK